MNRAPRLLVYCAGGFEHAGGIGRVLANLFEANRAAARPYTPTMIDTRGPYSIYISPIFFAAALARTITMTMFHGRVAAHVNMAHAGSTIRKVVVCRLLRALGIPYLLHLHANNYDTYYQAQPGWGKALIRATFCEAHKIVVLGTRWRDVVVNEIGADPNSVLIIRNGVPDPGRPPPRHQASCPLILFLGDLQPWKGLGELIDALASDSLRNRPWRLVCAGRGRQTEYQMAAQAAGIADKITFVGWLPRDGVQRLLRETRILALPSHLEGLSVTLVEALAQAIPVIATPVGAHPDILHDGQNAILVDAGDTRSLARGLNRLLEDDELADRIAHAGRMLFEQCLDISRIEKEFDEIYRDLI